MTRREIVRCENCVCWRRGPTERGTESVFGLCRRDPEPRTTSEDWGCHGGLERDGESREVATHGPAPTHQLSCVVAGGASDATYLAMREVFAKVSDGLFRSVVAPGIGGHMLVTVWARAVDCEPGHLTRFEAICDDEEDGR